MLRVEVSCTHASVQCEIQPFKCSHRLQKFSLGLNMKKMRIFLHNLIFIHVRIRFSPSQLQLLTLNVPMETSTLFSGILKPVLIMALR